MYVVLYRWRIKEGYEEQFIENWSKITAFYREFAGSLGSRLHRGSDQIFYAYAQWPSKEIRSRAFGLFTDEVVRTRMTESVAESFPEVELEIASDFLLQLP